MRDKGSFRKLGILGIVLAIASTGLLYASYAQYQEVRAFLEEATGTEGTVVKLKKVRSGRNPPTTNYVPLILYSTQHGQEIEFVGSAGTNPPSYSVGQKVDVFYLEFKPQNAKIDDFESLWGGAAIVGGIGGGVFFMSALMMLVAFVKRSRRAS